MKNILTLLLLPLIAFAQPTVHYGNDMIIVEFQMDSAILSELDKHLQTYAFEDSRAEFSVSVEVFIEERIPTNTITTPIRRLAPRYLETFSLVGLYPYESTSETPRERLNRALAMNDPEFPKEDTLLKGLNPVRYEKYLLNEGSTILKGFGPQISL